MKKRSNSTLKNTLAVTIIGGGLISGLTTQKADAAILVRGVETGAGDVVFTLSGSLDVTGLTPNSTNSITGSSRIRPNRGIVRFNPTASTSTDVYRNLLDNPLALIFGDDGTTQADSFSSGDFFFLRADNDNTPVRLPAGYSGGSLSGTMTFSGEDFDSLGINPGTYTSGFNSGADTITYQFQEVPEPITILGTMTALGFGTLMKKRKKQNA